MKIEHVELRDESSGNHRKTSQTDFYCGMRMRSVQSEKELAKQGHGFISDTFFGNELVASAWDRQRRYNATSETEGVEEHLKRSSTRSV